MRNGLEDLADRIRFGAESTPRPSKLASDELVVELSDADAIGDAIGNAIGDADGNDADVHDAMEGPLFCFLSDSIESSMECSMECSMEDSLADSAHWTCRSSNSDILVPTPRKSRALPSPTSRELWITAGVSTVSTVSTAESSMIRYSIRSVDRLSRGDSARRSPAEDSPRGVRLEAGRIIAEGLETVSDLAGKASTREEAKRMAGTYWMLANQYGGTGETGNSTVESFTRRVREHVFVRNLARTAAKFIDTAVFDVCAKVLIDVVEKGNCALFYEGITRRLAAEPSDRGEHPHRHDH